MAGRSHERSGNAGSKLRRAGVPAAAAALILGILGNGSACSHTSESGSGTSTGTSANTNGALVSVTTAAGDNPTNLDLWCEPSNPILAVTSAMPKNGKFDVSFTAVHDTNSLQDAGSSGALEKLHLNNYEQIFEGRIGHMLVTPDSPTGATEVYMKIYYGEYDFNHDKWLGLGLTAECNGTPSGPALAPPPK